MFRLDGKAALVTGASGGIGAAIARALHAQGASWCCPARGGTRWTRCRPSSGSAPSSAPPICATRRRRTRWSRRPRRRPGRCAILVNNAGLTRDMLALRMKDEDWQAVLEVDLTAPFRLARAALRGMLRRRAGRIIDISSIVGATGNPGQANYAAAKAGLIGMTKALAQEVASRGITVNVVAPGFIETPMTDALGPRRSERKLTEAIPLRPAGPAGGRRGGGGLSGLGRGRLGHRRDAARQWRDGDALMTSSAERLARIASVRNHAIRARPPAVRVQHRGRRPLI